MKFNSKTSKTRGDVGGSSSSTPVSSIQSTNNKVQFRFMLLFLLELVLLLSLSMLM
jgi:hypothetical protein